MVQLEKEAFEGESIIRNFFRLMLSVLKKFFSPEIRTLSICQFIYVDASFFAAVTKYNNHICM